MNPRYFVCGIHTDAGKTVASAVLVKALGASYWKPVQAGDLDFSDTHKVLQYLLPESIQAFPEAYRLPYPLSPHASAERAGVWVDPAKIVVPEHQKALVIEGAGGLLVPINRQTLYIDLIPSFNAKVVLVSRHYLGSINHTLLSIEALKSRNIPIEGILFNGAENPETESLITEYTGVRVIGRIDQAESLNAEFFETQARKLKQAL
jgi:dethiobiotin synthetase